MPNTSRIAALALALALGLLPGVVRAGTAFVQTNGNSNGGVSASSYTPNAFSSSVSTLDEVVTTCLWYGTTARTLSSISYNSGSETLTGSPSSATVSTNIMAVESGYAPGSGNTTNATCNLSGAASEGIDAFSVELSGWSSFSAVHSGICNTGGGCTASIAHSALASGHFASAGSGDEYALNNISCGTGWTSQEMASALWAMCQGSDTSSNTMTNTSEGGWGMVIYVVDNVQTASGQNFVRGASYAPADAPFETVASPSVAWWSWHHRPGDTLTLVLSDERDLHLVGI